MWPGIAILLALLLCSPAQAEEAMPLCRIVLGEQAVRLSGIKDELAFKVCRVSPDSKDTPYRLSAVWRSPQGLCHFLQESAPYVRGRAYRAVPADPAVMRQKQPAYTLYSSFSSNCGKQDDPDYFVSYASEQALLKMRAMWQAVHANDHSFAAFALRFKDATDGASKQWRRGELSIGFISIFDPDTPWWKRLPRIRTHEYALGLRHGCCSTLMGTLEVDDDAALITALHPSIVD